VYGVHASAEAAVRRLQSDGIPMQSISSVGKDFQAVEQPIGLVTTGTVANWLDILRRRHENEVTIIYRRKLMSAKVDKFCDNLRDRLNAVEGRFISVKTNVQGFPKQAEKALRERLDEVRAKLHAQKDRVERTRANIKARSQQKMAETKEMVSEWKTKHEARRLSARADMAEAYAADMIDFADATIAEAEEAILDAVVARIDADAAQLAAPASR
jgi:vacuolar-type H+-ATPase subunit I/STV1